MQSVKVNIEKCILIGNELQEYELHTEFLSRPFLTNKLDQETRLRMLLFSVAICHQTHSLRNEKLNLSGWEYLEYVFLKLAETGSELLNPVYISKISEVSLGKELLILFSENNLAENSSLDRIEERVNLYKATARLLVQKYHSQVSTLIRSSGNFLLDRGNGLYELLEEFEAFRDPLRKKSTFFIKLAIDSQLFFLKDDENFIPIMDYHMQRVLLRTGCLEIHDEELFESLVMKIPVESDYLIREACVRALALVSKYSGFHILTMNDIFWPLGRSCCNDNCVCVSGYCSKEPCSITKSLVIKNHKHCIFENCCSGKNDEKIRSLWQPVVKTHFY
jgi:hypothetical protein